MLPGADQEWQPLDPAIACLGFALVELTRLHPDAWVLEIHGWTIVDEAEKYRPDLVELAWAWDAARGVLADLLDSGKGSALALLTSSQMDRLSG